MACEQEGEVNDAVRRDPAAMAEAIRHSIPVNDALADHPLIVSWVGYEDEPARCGLLGLLNGIMALDGEKIEADLDLDTWTLKGFRLRSEEEKERLEMARSEA
jgi:hypothetical protein